MDAGREAAFGPSGVSAPTRCATQCPCQLHTKQVLLKFYGIEPFQLSSDRLSRSRRLIALGKFPVPLS
jgi:hypothetical protein